MPPKLGASENPVKITTPNTCKNFNITWNTGSPREGTVLKAIIPANPQPFDSGSGKVDHTKSDTITLGSTHEYRLTETQSGNLLATLIVTAQQVRPPIAVDIDPTDIRVGTHIAGTLGLIQQIRNLRVVPGLDRVFFKFETTQRTVPVIQVATAPPGPGSSCL